MFQSKNKHAILFFLRKSTRCSRGCFRRRGSLFRNLFPGTVCRRRALAIALLSRLCGCCCCCICSGSGACDGSRCRLLLLATAIVVVVALVKIKSSPQTTQFASNFCKHSLGIELSQPLLDVVCNLFSVLLHKENVSSVIFLFRLGLCSCCWRWRWR